MKFCNNFDFILFFFSSAELGDFEEETHNPGLISEFRVVQNQNEEFELDVMEAYKKLK